MKLKIDLQDIHLLKRYTWYIHVRGYVIADAPRKNGVRQTVFLHRLIAQPSAGQFVDHTNGVTSDNRRINLRVCNKSENARNSKLYESSRSGFKGVSWHKAAKKWRAYITKAPLKPLHLGLFNTKKDAARAYNEAALNYFGEFARLNIL